MSASSLPGLPSGQPRYLMVAQAIMSDIQSGQYPVGSMLPTEADFCRIYSVSRHTVREAIRRLAGLGMVSAQVGVGTMVKAHQPVSRYVQTAEGISDLFQYVREVDLRIVKRQEVIADKDLAALLSGKVGQKWHALMGERYVSGGSDPIALTTVYVAASYGQALDHIPGDSQPIYTIIERVCGVTLQEVRQEITAVTLDDASAKTLGVALGSPGLQVVRKYYSARNELFEVGINLHPAERFSHVSTLRLNGNLETQ